MYTTEESLTVFMYASQMEEAETIKQYLKDLISVMANRAEKEVDILMPGYTHVQVRVPFRTRFSVTVS